MSDHSELIARAEQIQEGVTEGPWMSRCAGNIHYGVSHGDYNFPTVVKAHVSYDGYGSGSTRVDAEFIAAARTLVPDLTSALKGAQAEIERLHSWDGLMALLDEHWPADIFPTMPDREDRDPGPRIVSLIRWVDQLCAELEHLRDGCVGEPCSNPDHYEANQ